MKYGYKRCLQQLVEQQEQIIWVNKRNLPKYMSMKNTQELKGMFQTSGYKCISKSDDVDIYVYLHTSYEESCSLGTLTYQNHTIALQTMPCITRRKRKNRYVYKAWGIDEKGCTYQIYWYRTKLVDFYENLVQIGTPNLLVVTG